MRYWLNVGHLQLDLLLAGVPQQVIGKLLHADDTGVTILKENDGTIHTYAPGVVQHVTPAP